ELQARQPALNEKQLTTEKAKAQRALETRINRVGDEEELAAQELQEIVEKISGAKLPIQRVERRQEITGPAIILGQSLARQAGMGAELDKLEQDGLRIATRGNDLFLSGRHARGTLYAVYELLEEMGCRWVMPGQFGEIYPELK